MENERPGGVVRGRRLRDETGPKTKKAQKRSPEREHAAETVPIKVRRSAGSIGKVGACLEG